MGHQPKHLIRAEGTALTPIPGSGGHVAYAVRELEAFAAKKRRRATDDEASLDGETIAAIFDALAAGTSLADIVRKHRLHPDLVESIAARWGRMRGSTLALSQRDVVQLLEQLGSEDPPTVTTPADLVAEVVKHRKALTLKILSGSTSASSADGATPGILERLVTEFRHELSNDATFLGIVGSETTYVVDNPSLLDDHLVAIWEKALVRLRVALSRRVRRLQASHE